MCRGQAFLMKITEHNNECYCGLLLLLLCLCFIRSQQHCQCNGNFSSLLLNTCQTNLIHSFSGKSEFVHLQAFRGSHFDWEIGTECLSVLQCLQSATVAASYSHHNILRVHNSGTQRLPSVL